MIPAPPHDTTDSSRLKPPFPAWGETAKVVETGKSAERAGRFHVSSPPIRLSGVGSGVYILPRALGHAVLLGTCLMQSIASRLNRRMRSGNTVAMRSRALLALIIGGSAAQQVSNNFTILNGQLYTPGLAIIDSPLPGTPLGGDSLQVAIDVSGDGRLKDPQPPAQPDVSTGLYNVTLFLFSYVTGLNLTISNGTSADWLNSTEQPEEFACPSAQDGDFQQAGCQPVMTQEPGSTVKHVNWVWPDCLSGDGAGEDGCGSSRHSVLDCLEGNARGSYNISIHQVFRMNGTAYYSIFNIPINVTNSINKNTTRSASGKRPNCGALNNGLLGDDLEFDSATLLPYQPYLGGDVGTQNGKGTFGKGGLSAASTSGVDPRLVLGVVGAVTIGWWLL